MLQSSAAATKLAGGLHLLKVACRWQVTAVLRCIQPNLRRLKGNEWTFKVFQIGGTLTEKMRVVRRRAVEVISAALKQNEGITQ